MPFSPSHLKWWLAAGLVAGAVVQSATAQSPIIFSQPTDDKTVKTNPSMPPPSHNIPSSFNAPSSVFGGAPGASFDILPGSSRPVPLTTEQTSQLRKLIETEKNWTLMTPEEILGLQTPEEILGLPDPGNDQKFSPEERYLRRENREQSMVMSNSIAGAGGFLNDGPNPFQSRSANVRSASLGDLTGKQTGLQPQQLLNQSWNATSLPRFGADQNQKPDSMWTSAFDVPASSAKANAEQEAARMEQFRALLNPVSQTEDSTTPAGFSKPVTPAPDPNLEVLPQYNPMGNSFTPLQSSVGKPGGIIPLPGITGYPKKPEKPKPLVQTPPWLSDEPQPGVPPQRVF